MLNSLPLYTPLTESSHVAYQINGNEAENTMQANTLPYYTPTTPDGILYVCVSISFTYHLRVSRSSEDKFLITCISSLQAFTVYTRQSFYIYKCWCVFNLFLDTTYRLLNPPNKSRKPTTLKVFQSSICK